MYGLNTFMLNKELKPVKLSLIMFLIHIPFLINLQNYLSVMITNGSLNYYN